MVATENIEIPVMTAAASKAAVPKESRPKEKPAKSSGRLCRKCGEHELRRAPRTLADKIVGLQPFMCQRCLKGSRKPFRMWLMPVILSLISLIGWACYIVVSQRNAQAAAPSTEAEILARARSGAGGRLSTYEEMMMKKTRPTLDNSTVLRLWKANVSSIVILQMIKTSNADYDLGAGAIIELREANVDQTLILAMIDEAYGKR